MICQIKKEVHMKHNKTLITIIVSIMGILLFSCGTSQTAVEKANQAQLLNEQIRNFNFKFNATYAHPQSYRPIYLSSSYDVKVSPDTVQAYLPFFGRAYTAPMNPSEGGINFESTEFRHEIKQGKKAGNWLITIRTKDTTRPFVLFFDLWDNGTGSLNVQDRYRQPISFQGNIEVQKKPE